MSTKLSVDPLPKGLFLASFCLLVWMALFAMVVRVNALPNLAELLPGDETDAFWIFNAADQSDAQVELPAEMSLFMGTPLMQLTWIESFGGAWVDGRDVQVAEVNSRSDAKAFLENLKTPEEEFLESSAGDSLWSTVYCYEQSQPYCFTWVGDLLFASLDKDLLLSIQSTALGELDSLESTSNYQNVRGRLAHWNSGFYYFDVRAVSSRFVDDAGAFGSLLELFPAFGGVVDYQNLENEKGFLSESFLALDKKLLGGEAFFHPTDAYEQKFLPWTSEGMAWEWGGQNLYGQWQRLGQILDTVSPASGITWQAESRALLTRWFGSDFDLETELTPLLNEEQYFGFTPGGDFLFITELQVDEVKQADALKDRLADHLTFALTHTDDKGETTAEIVKPTVERSEHNATVTYEFIANGEVKLSMVLLSNALILSSSKELALSTLDKALGQSEGRNLQVMEGLLPGSDEVLILHCPLLPDGNILKTLGGEFESLFSTRKLFDDGVFTRSYASMTE